MNKSPKYYQKNKEYDKALDIFVQKYMEEIYNGDCYLSQLYMDEIIQTILEKSAIKQNDEKLDSVKLDSIIRKLLKEKNVNFNDYSEQIDNDLKISITKRFKIFKSIN